VLYIYTMCAKVSNSVTAKKSAAAAPKKSATPAAAPKKSATPAAVPKKSASKNVKSTLFQFVGAWLEETGATESVCGRWGEQEKAFKVLVKKSKGKPKKDPAAPKRASSAYIYFSKEKRAEAKEALIEEGTEKPSIGDVAKRLGEMWKKAGPKTKAKYEAMATKDKARYDSAMSEYTPSDEFLASGGKKKKDPNAPKRAITSYMYFCKEKREEAKEALIEEGSEKPSLGEVAKRLGEMWSNASAKTKSKYEALAAKDKVRYEAEMTKYQKKGKKAKAEDEEEEEGGEENGEEGGEEEEEVKPKKGKTPPPKSKTQKKPKEEEEEGEEGGEEEPFYEEEGGEEGEGGEEEGEGDEEEGA
jgi:hypothetical protein